MKLALLIAALFSGEWRMDPGKSSFGPAPALTSLTRKVEMSGLLLTVTDEQMGGPPRRQTVIRNYSLDGRETVNTWMGVDLKTKTVWNGKSLVMTSSVEGARLIDKWSLAGGEFIDEIHVMEPQGEYFMTYVLRKQ